MKLTKREKEFVLKGRRRSKVGVNSQRITAYRNSSQPSKGEQKIINFLISECINFRREWYFKSCYSPSTRHLLYFDFFLFDYNLCIEFDGEQHYSKEKSVAEQLNDFTKTAYCAKNRINLLRIKYDQYESIETIICSKIDKITNKVYVIP